MKLQGSDALNKANKLFEFMETKPKTDSYSNVESVHLAYDGKHYGIVKENSKYVLKVSNDANPTLAEDFDYINGVQNKSKYVSNSYNDAYKGFNLMNIEFSRHHGDKLMKEALEEKKYVISTKKKSSNEPVDDFGDDSLGDSEIPMDGENMSGGEDFSDMESDSEEPSESPDDYADVDPDTVDEDPEKAIQKLSGKLAYELREFDDEDKYSDTAKFAMSMATSALQVGKMSEEDKNAIEKKISSKFEESGSGEEEFPADGEMSGEENEVTNEPEDVEGKGLEETKTALDNIHNKVGSFAIDEPMMESIVFTKKQVLESLSNGKNLLSEADAMERWAERISSMFNRGKIGSTMELLKIIENNIEDHNLDVDFYDLRQEFNKRIKGSKVTSQLIKDIVDASMPKPSFENLDEDIYFEEENEDNILFDTEDDLNPYEVEKDEILFDLDEESEDVFEISLDEDYDLEEEKNFQSEIDLDSLEKKVEQYSSYPSRNVNLIKHINNLIKKTKGNLKYIDYEMDYSIDRFYKYKGGKVSDVFERGLEQAINKMNYFYRLFKKLYDYRYNPWIKRMREVGKDEQGIELMNMVEQLYINFLDVKEDYMKKLHQQESEEVQEEDVYSQKPKKIKNRKYTQNYFGMDVGRVVGDDDAEYILEDDDVEDDDLDFGKIHVTKQEPRNPFKYKG